MASQIDVINMALAYLGQGPTDTVDSNRARETVRKLMVFAAPALDWATQQAEWLALQMPIPVAPLSLPEGYQGQLAFAYPLPDGYGRIVRVRTGREEINRGPDPQWRIGLYDPRTGEPARAVLWCSARLSEIWVTVLPEWSLLPPHLVRLVALKIARDAAVAVNPDNVGAVRNGLDQDLRLALMEAAAQDGVSASAPNDIYAAPDQSGAHVWSPLRA